MVTNRQHRRASNRERSTQNLILRLTKHIRSDGAREAVLLLAAEHPPEEVARIIAGARPRAQALD